MRRLPFTARIVAASVVWAGLAATGPIACRPQTAPYDPQVLMRVGPASATMSSARRTRGIKPAAGLELADSEYPRGTRSSQASEVWVEPDALPSRGLKTSR